MLLHSTEEHLVLFQPSMDGWLPRSVVRPGFVWACPNRKVGFFFVLVHDGAPYP